MGSWARIVILYGTGLGAAGQFAKLSVPFEQVEAAYPQAGTSLGLAVSALSLLGAALGLVAGMVVARAGYVRVLVWALTGGAVLSAAQALLPPLPVLLALRVAEGATHLAIVVAAPTLMAQIANDAQRPGAMALWSTFFGTGFALFAWLGLPIADLHGAAPLIWSHAVLMAVLALVVARTIPATGLAVPEVLNLPEILRRHAQVYSDPALAAPALGWLCYTLTFLSVLTLLPFFSDAAWLAGVLPLVGIVLSLTLVAALLRWMAAVRVVILGFALAAVLALPLLAAPGAAWLWFAVFAALSLVQAGSFAAIPQLVSDAKGRAVANGAVAQMGNLGNLLGTPILLMLITSGGGVRAGIVAMIACFAAGTGLHLWMARRRGLI